MYKSLTRVVYIEHIHLHFCAIFTITMLLTQLYVTVNRDFFADLGFYQIFFNLFNVIFFSPILSSIETEGLIMSAKMCDIDNLLYIRNCMNAQAE